MTVDPRYVGTWELTSWCPGVELVEGKDEGVAARASGWVPDAAESINPMRDRKGPLRVLREHVRETYQHEGTANIEGSRAIGLLLAYGADERVLRAQLFTGDHGWGLRLPARDEIEALGRALLAAPR